MKNKKQDSGNFLDYIPSVNEKYKVKIAEDGAVTIYVENKGFFNRIAQKVFHRPEVSQVHLEKMGSFIWPLIDGHRTIYEIGQIVHESFGEEAEPLYERLTQYFQSLQAYEFIRISSPEVTK